MNYKIFKIDEAIEKISKKEKNLKAKLSYSSDCIEDVYKIYTSVTDQVWSDKIEKSNLIAPTKRCIIKNLYTEITDTSVLEEYCAVRFTAEILDLLKKSKGCEMMIMSEEYKTISDAIEMQGVCAVKYYDEEEIGIFSIKNSITMCAYAFIDEDEDHLYCIERQNVCNEIAKILNI